MPTVIKFENATGISLVEEMIRIEILTGSLQPRDDASIQISNFEDVSQNPEANGPDGPVRFLQEKFANIASLRRGCFGLGAHREAVMHQGLSASTAVREEWLFTRNHIADRFFHNI